MRSNKLQLGAALAFSVGVILALLCQPGIAAPLPSERAAPDGVSEAVRLAQAAGQRETAPQAAKADAKTRTAQSKKVSVHVFLLSDREAPNPDEYLEANGARYIYFNSPRLASPARPLAEPKPRYPGGKLERPDGAVILQLLINEHGILDHVGVVCSAPAFEKSAQDSVKGMRFRPARGKDGPVKSYMLVEFGYGRGFPCARVPD